jgi:hypothetical protein
MLVPRTVTGAAATGTKDVPLPKPRPKDIVADATPANSTANAVPVAKPRP